MSCSCQQHSDETPSTPVIPAGAREETFRVSGMDCSEEVAAIERAVKPLRGVLGVRANIVVSTVSIYHDGSVKAADLAVAVNSSGVKVEAGAPLKPGKRKALSTAALLVATSGVFTGIGILLQWIGFKTGWRPSIPFTIAMFAGGWLVVPKAIRSLRTFSLDLKEARF